MEQNPIIIISPKLSSINSTMEKLIDEMEKGKKSTQILRNMLLQRPRLKVEDHNHNDDEEEEDYFKALDHHCMVALTSYVTSLSLMRRRCDLDGEINGKRKMNHDLDYHHSLGGGFKHIDLCGEVPDLPTNSKERRGCYKRRRSDEGRAEEVTHLRDDGYGWRKYGQKVILNAIHPRNYYRCTHKFDKKCPATKQVQQISENPTKYQIIYHGNHICNYNNLNQSPIIIDDYSHEHHSSAIVLSFDQKNQVNPLLFPTSATSPATAVKHEYNSPPFDQSTSQDHTAITGPSSSTLVSEQSDLISTAENWCSTTTHNEVEEDYSCIWTDLEVIHDLFPYQSRDFGINFA